MKPVPGDNLMADSVAALRSFNKALDAAYGPCADDRREMSAEEGKGTLADMIAFVRQPSAAA